MSGAGGVEWGGAEGCEDKARLITALLPPPTPRARLLRTSRVTKFSRQPRHAGVITDSLPATERLSQLPRSSPAGTWAWL